MKGEHDVGLNLTKAAADAVEKGLVSAGAGAGRSAKTTAKTVTVAIMKAKIRKLKVTFVVHVLR